jgi:prepilin-type N-terminal cleavage/methylation domain-containing protein
MSIRRNARGFVMIELLIAISIIAILSVVAGFTGRRLLEQKILDQYARQMKTDLIFAEDEAIRLHSGTIIQLNRSDPGYKVMVQGIYVRNRCAPSFIRYKWSTLPLVSNYILYDSHGRTTTGGQLVLTDSFGDIRDVILYMQSGQIRIEPHVDS